MQLIFVRPAVANEITHLAEIGLSAWQRGIQPLVTADVARKIANSNPFLPFLRESMNQVLVGEIDGRPAGIGACEHGDNTITDIWVVPAFEGCGIATALINTLEKQIAARGCSQSSISVAAQNDRAHKLYLHLGYRETQRAVKYDPILDMELEKIDLIKHLR